MDCNDCVDRLYAFLDSELSADELTAVRSHIARCDDCGDNFDLEARFLAQLKEWCTADVAPEDLRARVTAILRSESPPPS